MKMAQEGCSMEAIVERTEQLMDVSKSWLMPADFAYLRRGGRLSPMVSYVGQVANLAPVMTQTDDGQQLSIAAVRRGFKNAVSFIGKTMAETYKVGKGWTVYISHGAALAKAEQALAILKPMFPEASFEILPLSPAFITQGGPECVAVQIIHD